MSAAITLAQADAIADRALHAGRRLNFQPLTVAILDAGGHLKVLKRADDCSLLRPDIAVGKAWAALGMGFGGRELARRAQSAPTFFSALNAVSGGRMVPAAGGVLIREPGGAVIGAIGISGDNSDNDEKCAVEAVKEEGLVPDTGDPST